MTNKYRIKDLKTHKQLNELVDGISNHEKETKERIIKALYKARHWAFWDLIKKTIQEA